MSCEFQLIATLEGVDKFLRVKGGKSDNDNESDGFEKTLQSFKIAVSPTDEIVVFAKSTWLLICGSKWNSSVADGPKIKYSPNWHGHITCMSGEEITSVFCLPFFSQGQNSLTGSDWTCVILGFSSGYIRFYTEDMQELASTILYEEEVTVIKCFSPNLISSEVDKQSNSDIYILFKTVICIINKHHLSLILRNKRNDLAKDRLNTNNESKNYLPIEFKIYNFVGQEEITDACFLRQTLISSFNTFDHLVTASLVGGLNSNYSASPPQTSLIVTTGRKPFVGFHYTLEGGSSPVLADVALAVASKIKNSVTATLPDWFGFGSKKSVESEKPKEYAERLNCRFGLNDSMRQGQSIIVSPDGVFSAVTDSLGRVMLIDNASGIAHRLWKGYRDAQCGFLLVQEDCKKHRKARGKNAQSFSRQGLFIVIYAPKRGLIEVFAVQHGRRVASFKVTKHGYLLYAPEAFGNSSVSTEGFHLSQNQVIFISEEGFSGFSIPFHCALAEKSSIISRDLLVLKKMKILLKMESSSENPKFLEDIEKCAKELKTDDVRLQGIESMITYRNVTLEPFKTILNVFLEALKNEDRAEPAQKKIITFAETTNNLLLLYDFVTGLQHSEQKSETVSEKPKNANLLSEELRLPQNELDVILKVIDQIKEIEGIKSQTTKVAFDEKKSAKLTQYLSCFDFESFLGFLNKNEKQEELKESHSCILHLKPTRKENSLCYLGEVFFSGIFNSFSLIDQWKKYVVKCCLNPKDLALCLISYWCNKEIVDDVFHEMLIFVEILKIICSFTEPYAIVVEYNDESPWWKELRNFIGENSFTLRGLLAALCCRSVTIFLEQERELLQKCTSEKKIASKVNESLSTSDSAALYSDWEAISKDSCQWDILITQLQDVALLNAVLNLRFKPQNHFPEIPFDFQRQSLTSIQICGTGRVSELVAKWLVQFGFEPSVLIDSNDLEFQRSGEKKEVENEISGLIYAMDKVNETKNTDESLNLALDYLALLKSRFPYSLTSSSLISNICWEYFSHWFKNITDIEYLESAVRYIEAIPSCRIKYGISYLSWKTYIEQKFITLATMINRLGKVPTDKLCVQEIGLKNNQVPMFLRLISDVLKIILHTDTEDKPDFGTNRETIWQSSSTMTESSLVVIALSQPVINSDLILFQLQLSTSLFMMSSLNFKHHKVFSSLFDNSEPSSFTEGTPSQFNSHYQNLKLKDLRTEFLKKCITAAVQTIVIVEDIFPVSSSEVLPTTKLKVESYKKWLQLCFDLATMWAVPLDELRKHQICELYFGSFDRLAEEVISSVNDTNDLASKLLVLGGKRLKYLIQDSGNVSLQMTSLSANLSKWLHTLDLENFTYHGTIDDIEILMRYTARLLPEDHADQNLAVAIIESVSFLKNKTT